MAKVLVAYLSRTGTTEKMAEYVGEGVRMAGQQADVRSIADIGPGDLAGYDGYVFGSPTYHLDMPGAFGAFLDMAQEAGLRGKAGGAFSPRTHPSSGGGGAAERIFAAMESRIGMRMTDLGAFDVKAEVMDGPDGMRACQEYGKSVAKLLA